MQSESWRERTALYVVLIAAVLQGWALYGLHFAITENLQITDWTVFPALYALAVFTPLTVQLLAQHARERLMWLLVLALSAVLFGLAWHQSSLRLADTRLPELFESLVPSAFALALLWVHAVPFLQVRLLRGRWRPRYPDLFAASWRDVLVLLEAAVFTGALWILLFLWAQLFRMLDFDFFGELFRAPMFAYPVTALAFGIAIHLIGSVDRMVSVVLDQVLSLFKWLGLVAGVILVFFTLALLTRVPALVENGTRAISAQWLLWLVALTVLLLNAAWRDGTAANPYPRVLGNALRLAVPMLVIVALTALFSLIVRADNYGLTVQRVWAFVVAALALAYALGYSLAALRSGQWLASLGNTNVAVALAFMVLMVLFLTPPLSPQRLTASSQYSRVLAATSDKSAEDAIRVLRFETGSYGRAHLLDLRALVDHPRAAVIREVASRMLAMRDSDRFLPPSSQEELAQRADTMKVYPAGRSVDPALRAALLGPGGSPVPSRFLMCRFEDRCVGLFVNIDESPEEEFVVLSRARSLVYSIRGGTWSEAQQGFAAVGQNWDGVLAALDKGDFGTTPIQLLDLRIGTFKLPAVRPAEQTAPVVR